MNFLADDLLEGREPGTRGYDIAANYVATQFALAGLTPAGAAGSYLQPVPLIEYRRTGSPRFELRDANGRRTELISGEDFGFGGWPTQSEVALSAPIVFAGYGIVAPERGRDDFAGLDVAGKIVIVLQGAPDAFTGDEGAHYQSGALKRVEAEKRGAVGLIVAVSLADENPNPAAPPLTPPSLPWTMGWKSPAGVPHFRGGRVVPVGRVDGSGMAKLLAGGPMTLAQLRVAASTPDGAFRGFALPSTATIALSTEVRDVRSHNVVGLIEGSDPELRDEAIVLTAHLDHIGVRTGQGDTINNGAMDNASGIATLIEVARGFQISGRRPRRSILFLAVTAEEKGLIGADYFVHHPSLPGVSLVANVNLDMPILTYGFTDVVAFGAERSTIGEAVAKVTARMGLKVSPDPMPEQGFFTRSDRYRFVEQGIPAVFVQPGPADGGDAASERFLRSCYHRPCDDMNQPIDFEAASRFVRLNYELARELADAAERPRWHPGDFFGSRASGQIRAAPPR